MSHSLSSAIRGVLAVLLGLVAVVLAALSVALCWFQQDLQNEDRFVATTSSLSSDQQFRDQLVDASVQDVMSSEVVTRYLGDGNSQGHLFSGLSNWFHDKAEGIMHDAAQKAADSEEFRSVWEQAARQTHQADFDGSERKTLVVDASPLYRAVDERVRSAIGVDLGLEDGDHLVAVEQVPDGAQEAPGAAFIRVGQEWTSRLPVLITLAVVAALAAAVLARRWWALALGAVCAGAGLATWGVFLLLHQRMQDAVAGAEGAGGVVARHLVSALTQNQPSWGLTSLGVGLGAAVLLIIAHVVLAARRGNAEVL